MSRCIGLVLSVGVVLWAGCASAPRVRDIEALGQRGDVRALLEHLRDSRSWVREEAARVLGSRRMEPARAALMQRALAEDERRYVRGAAVRALGRIGHARDRERLEALAEMPGVAPELKLALVAAVCRLQPTSATFDLLAALKADADLLVAASAATEFDRRCAR